jgi:TRAP transporter TAXI family solute receptor
MLKFRKRSSFILVLTFVLAVSLVIGGCGSSSSNPGQDADSNGENATQTKNEKVNLVFMSGPSGSSWYAQATVLPTILSNHYGWSVDVRPGQAISNAMMVENGKADIGLTWVSLTQAMKKGEILTEDFFATPFKNAMQMMNSTSGAYVHLVDAKSPYYSTSDLKGKGFRYVTYPPGFATGYGNEIILDVHGITLEDIEKNGGKIITVNKFEEAVDLLAKGQADVISYAMPTVSATASITELEAQREFRVLTIDENLIDEVISRVPIGVDILPAGLQKSIKEDVKVFVDITTWLVPSTLSEETVEKILDAVLAEMDLLGEIGQAEFRGFEAKDLCRMYGLGTQLPYHPGAVKFYAKHGIKVE